MDTYKSFEEMRAEGRAEGRADMLRRQIEMKFGALTPEVDQIISSASPELIDRYLERILFAASIENVVG